MNLATELATFAAGTFAGGLGAVLGLGGGVILMPFLNKVLGLSLDQASGISVITIIATSSAASASRSGLKLTNLRLGMLLEIFTTTGGVFGLWWFGRTSDAAKEQIFAWMLILIALVVFSRLDKRNVLKDEPSLDVGLLGGRFEEAESGGVVAYRVRRPVLAFVTSFLAGMASNFGIGGGVLKVPVLNAWCGVPIRAAAATSALMLGATALIVAADRFSHGQIVPELAAAAVLGVLVGSRAGSWFQHRSKARTQKIGLIAILVVVAGIYLSGIGH